MIKDSEKFHFSDFTIENHQKLLKLAKKKYIFRFYNNFDRNEKFIIWRHDVDISVYDSLKLAKIEVEEGVFTTYCVHLHSEHYNLLSHRIKKDILDIIEMGHQIGLHFDTSYFDITDINKFEKYLIMEKKILEAMFDCKIHIFAFHNSTPFAMSCKEWKYCGMINAYADYFRQEVGYCSDSNGIWRFRRLKDVLEEGKDQRLQVLTHPVWWQEKVRSPRKRMEFAVKRHLERNIEFYDKSLKSHGRPNI